jgi:hypothetical protein
LGHFAIVLGAEQLIRGVVNVFLNKPDAAIAE